MYKVLIVDDQVDLRSTLGNVVREAGYEVELAADPTEALDMFLQARVPFDFALVDVHLINPDDTDNSGVTLSVAFKKFRPNTIVILLTQYNRTKQVAWAVRYHGVYDFIRKSADLDRQILDTLRDAVQDLKFHENERDTFLSILLSSEQKSSIRSRGLYVLSAYSKQTLGFSIRNVVEQANFSVLSSPSWKNMVDGIGVDLWQKIFNANPEILGAFQSARNKSGRLAITFETSREDIGLPLEFLRTTDPEKYLVLQYPVNRMIVGISPKRNVVTPEWLALRKKLSILIIASNTTPDIPGVEREAEAVRNYLKSQEFINVDIKYISADDASYDDVCFELSSASYDIIHYAGHGKYDQANSNASAIYFWREKKRGGDVVKMTASQLSNILTSSNAKFVYLSCCFGSTTNNNSDDFLGVADAVIQAGIPSVLGFRSPVSDVRAIKMATVFYKSFLERGGLDIALWEARKTLAGDNIDDSTWLSPILICQH